MEHLTNPHRRWLRFRLVVRRGVDLVECRPCRVRSSARTWRQGTRLQRRASLGDLRSRCSRQLENGLLDLGGPSGGKGHFGTDRVEARLLKDS